MNNATEQDNSTEAGYLAHWASATMGYGENPMALARTGGQTADRLAWVFASGYQAAVRCCFPEFSPPEGAWTCFAAAEHEDFAGCVLEDTGDEYRLHGNKSWVAGAGVIERLVVAIGEGDSRVFAHVPRNAMGVDIQLPRKPGFLAELTQGVARFEGVAVAKQSVVSGRERGQRFRGAEPLFVLSALVACLARHAAKLNAEHPLLEAAGTLEAQASQLVDVLGVKEEIVPGLKTLRADVSVFLKDAEAIVAATPALQDSWQRDERFFRMFGLAAQPA